MYASKSCFNESITLKEFDMHSELSEDYLWFLVWGDGYIKKQLMFSTQVWNCACIRILSV